MTDVLVRLQAASLDQAEQMAAAIQEAGSVEYTDNSGSTVNVTIGDVSVENSGV